MFSLKTAARIDIVQPAITKSRKPRIVDDHVDGNEA